MATALALRSTDITNDGLRNDLRVSDSSVRYPAGIGHRRPQGRRITPVRPAGRGAQGASATRSRAGTACQGMPRTQKSVYARRRAWAIGILVGLGLAITVFTVALVGTGVENATLPVSTQTEIVHVRAGETIGDVAARVAPTMPSSLVINKILDLNGLPNAQLTAGQPLLAPVYQR